MNFLFSVTSQSLYNKVKNIKTRLFQVIYVVNLFPESTIPLPDWDSVTDQQVHCCWAFKARLLLNRIGSWCMMTGCSRIPFSFLAGGRSQWNDLVRSTLSPGVGSFHGAAGDHCAPAEERALGSTSLQRATEREDCYSDRSQYRSVEFNLVHSYVQDNNTALQRHAFISNIILWMWHHMVGWVE